jgi:putative ATPase
MDSSRDAKGLGHGQGYQYPHSFPGHFIPQQYLPSKLVGKHFYQPSDQGFEARIAERLAAWRAANKALSQEAQENHDDPLVDTSRGK